MIFIRSTWAPPQQHFRHLSVAHTGLGHCPDNQGNQGKAMASQGKSGQCQCHFPNAVFSMGPSECRSNSPEHIKFLCKVVYHSGWAWPLQVFIYCPRFLLSRACGVPGPFHYKKHLGCKVRAPATLQTLGLVTFTKSTWAPATLQTLVR